MSFKPLNDRILIKRVEEQTETPGGIIVPDTAQEKPFRGEVLAVGEGKLQDDGSVRPLDVKEGDKVVFGRFAGTDVEIEGEERTILREHDVLGVIEE